MTEDKQERDTPRKVRDDLEAQIKELKEQINSLTGAIIESAHIMGWPKDLLIANGLKPFDKETQKLSIKK